MNMFPAQPTPSFLTIYTHQLSECFKDFIELAGISQLRDISKKHKFYQALDYYFKHKNLNWRELQIPAHVLNLANDLASIVSLRYLIDVSSGGKPVKAFQRHELIETYIAEAMIITHFIQRGCNVFWPSIFNTDPPDIVIRDPNNQFSVDVEVKIKKRQGSIETMFDSFSKGLASLKSRRRANDMSIIVVHNSDDLNWADWLSNPDVLQRLTSRLMTNDYKIVSGVVFSGGSEIKKDSISTGYSTKLVAFRSNAATHPLPYGFLTSSSNI